MHIYMRNLKKPSTRNVNIPSSSDTCFSITPLKKLPSADFDGVPLRIRVSNPLAVNSLSKGDTSPTRRSLPWANRTDRCCGGLCRSRAPPCQNCLKKSPSADFDRLLLCIPVSNPLAVNSLSKGDTSPTRCSLPQPNQTDRCCGGLRRSRAPPAKTAWKNRPWPTSTESRSASKWAILLQ